MKDIPFLPLLAQYFERRPEITAAYLYGSYAEGVARRDSDVDIAVLTDPVPGNTLKYRLEVMEDARRLLKRSTEVIILNEAPRLLQFQVIQKGCIIYERSADKRAFFEMDIAGRYYDYKKYFDFHARHLAARIKEGGLGVRQ
ncbi:MAG: nucleotidyltransferase domain-containing protein [Actinobacteria bacterium]|nr:nucleotidyltransferase domain-containing protein [Actinomycetota bacterium]